MPDVEDLIALHAPWATIDRQWRLTPFEQFMWLDDRPAYPLVFEVVLRFAGPIDPVVMADAWRFAIARHPLLRATIRAISGSLIWDAPATGWADLALAGAVEEPPADLPRIDLEREPGLQGSLRETLEGWDLGLIFHHACCDGHGARMFLQDLVLAYTVLGGASAEEDPFFRSDAALLDERGKIPGVEGGRGAVWQRLKHAARFALLRPTPVASTISPGLAGCGQSAASLDAMPVDGGKPRLVHRATEWKKCMENFFHGRLAQPARHTSGSSLGHRSHTFSAEEVAGMDAIQQRFSATRNDIALAMLFSVLAGWQRTNRISPRARLRVAVPTDMRSRADERMPAANRYTYIFLERRVGDCGDWESLLPGLQRDFQERRQQGRGVEFLGSLQRAARFPQAMRWVLQRPTCFATAVLTNLSDPSWRLRKRLPVDAEGLMWLGKAQCLDIQIRTPPLRPGTRWGFGIFEYAGRMTISFRYDSTSITSAAADAIMECYVNHWQTLLATSEGCRQSAIASAAK